MEIKLKPIKPKIVKCRFNSTAHRLGYSHVCYSENPEWIMKFGCSPQDAYGNWKRRFDEIERIKNGIDTK